ncbi:metal-dependent hydrolase family protein [Streptomyces marincola]|uniref:metal-dependent hydrolase family protein n=1 Tax=Streptomyces marincola TaxID=2878388 RepID=UPI001CF33042|nr:amidohydrolase family protein [Streptomyces marincola]UCM89717.1 amidohydrolase family protein [Streptomyces marincola]
MAAGELTLDNALVFDGWSAELTETSLFVRDGVIAEIGPAVTRAERVIDARGRTVVPGLIDAHFHAYGVSLNNLEFDAGPLSYLALAGARRLRRALHRGFTTVRDVAGGDPGLARAVTTGLIEAPRYLYTGPALSQTGGHGDARPAEHDICLHGGHMNEVVDGVDDLRVAVRERFRRGAHAIKIMASGGVVSPTDPIRPAQYSAEEIAAVTAEAARRGSYVAAHAYSPEAIRHAVLNGVRSVEHGNLLDEPTAALLAEHGAYLVPTLAAYDAMNRRGDEVGLPAAGRAKNAEVLDAGRVAVERAHAAGVPVGFGSDLMGDLENDQLIGLRLQAEASGTLAALRSATSVNARLIGRDDLGRIAVGARADLLLLDADPVCDPAALWDTARPRLVIRAGTPVPEDGRVLA